MTNKCGKKKLKLKSELRKSIKEYREKLRKKKAGDS